MSGGYYVLIQFVAIFLDAISLAMLVRVILSWFQMGEGQSVFGNFLYVVTEPFILPIRVLFDRLGWFRNIPLDIPFFVTMILLSLIRVMLSGTI